MPIKSKNGKVLNWSKYPRLLSLKSERFLQLRFPTRLLSLQTGRISLAPSPIVQYFGCFCKISFYLQRDNCTKSNNLLMPPVHLSVCIRMSLLSPKTRKQFLVLQSTLIAREESAGWVVKYRRQILWLFFSNSMAVSASWLLSTEWRIRIDHFEIVPRTPRPKISWWSSNFSRLDGCSHDLRRAKRWNW